MMKSFALLPLLFAGCASVPPAPPVTPVVTTTAPSAAPAPTAQLPLEQRLRRQSQVIEALLSQNEALLGKAGDPSPVTVSDPRSLVGTMPPAVPPTPAPPAHEPIPTAAPNAEGLIDLTANVAPKPGEPVNPFAVRAAPVDTMREITLRVSGVIAGPVACAVINDRLVQAGDLVESLAVERIDPNTVYLRHEGQRLRLPVSGKPVRVRLPL
jgi:hypothetical protein